MLYEAQHSFKYGGRTIRPGNIINIKDKKDIEALKEVKAIISTDRKIESAMRPRYETRENVFKQPIEKHLKTKKKKKCKRYKNDNET